MKIGLISDTHGYLDAWEKAVEILGEIDMMIHTGDILSSGPFNPRYENYKPSDLAKAINSSPFQVVFAKGNCDAEIDTMALDYPIEAPYALVEKNGLTILATHGHLYEESNLVEIGKRYKLNLLVRGHTHIRGIQPYGSLHIINPGSASLPKNDDGVPSAGVVDMSDSTSILVRLFSLKDGSVLQEVKLARA